MNLAELLNTPNTVKFLYQKHHWDSPNVVLNTTFGHLQRSQSLTGGSHHEAKHKPDLANKVLHKRV